MKNSGEREIASSAGQRAAADGLLKELVRRGFEGAEVYAKQGKSRTFERASDRESMQVASEAGWAARAGDARRSLFLAGTGAPGAARALAAPIDPSPNPLLLPEARAAGTAETADADAAFTPLATESEASALFDAVERRLATELPGARLLKARLDDGASESVLVSSRGVRAEGRMRAAWLRLEAGRGSVRVELAAAERDGRRLRPDALARRLADRLAALAADPRDGGAVSPRAVVLAAPLAARLVEAVAPLFVGRGARTLLAPLLAGSATGDRISAEAITLVDDGRFEGGLLAAATDGEGVPTRRVVLVEKGVFRTPLLAWWEAEAAPGGPPPAGCARRASYREAPRRSPSQFFIEPGEAAASALLAEVDDGVFLIDAEGAVELRATTFEWSVRVSGFRLRSGEPPSPLGPCRLGGTVAALLEGVRAVARDLTFVPGDGMYGAPTLLVVPQAGGAGLELTPAALR